MRETFVNEFKEYATDGMKFNNQTIYRFPNGRGLSVIKGEGTYGLEAMEIYFLSKYSNKFEPFVDEPHGYLSRKELVELLQRVKEEDLS